MNSRIKLSTLLKVAFIFFTMATANKESLELITKSLNAFSWDIYKSLSSKGNGNIFLSPLSISSALAMVHMGSAGNTELELQKVMNFPENKTHVLDAFNYLIRNFKNTSSEYELKMSNMAYISNKLNLLADYEKVLLDDFLSSSKTVDFAEAEKIRGEINAVVAKETNNKIIDLLPIGFIDTLTRMVLVNAIYFKGVWEKEFEKSETEDRPFWITVNQSIQVPMMNKEDFFVLNELPELDAQALTLKYKGNRLSMVILLPNQRDGLKDLEERLNAEELVKIFQGGRRTKVIVSIPKFKLEETLDLKKVLINMGVADLFSQDADLSGMTGSRDLFVSDAIHKAFIDVNEEGTEAAAATAFRVVPMSGRRSTEPLKIFIADHPFCFCIVDEQNAENILFVGNKKF